MYKCEDCNQEFKYLSYLTRHKDRKTQCNKSTEDLKCNVCDVQFKSNYEKKRHEKSNRHIAKQSNINNVNIMNNTLHNSTINSIINNIHISLNPMNIFSKTNISLLKDYNLELLSKAGIQAWKDFLKYDSDHPEEYFDHYRHQTCNTKYMESLLDILKELNFNMANPQNNNCKILIFVTNNEQLLNEPLYLILEMNENNQYTWKQITYDMFINELLTLMNEIKTHFNIESFNIIMDHVNTYVKDNETMKQTIKKQIEIKTKNLVSSKFTCNSAVDNRKSMKDFMDNETKLYNGVESTIDLICRDFESS